jgi:hypothetical protein
MEQIIEYMMPAIYSDIQLYNNILEVILRHEQDNIIDDFINCLSDDINNPIIDNSNIEDKEDIISTLLDDDIEYNNDDMEELYNEVYGEEEDDEELYDDNDDNDNTDDVIIDINEESEEDMIYRNYFYYLTNQDQEPIHKYFEYKIKLDDIIKSKIDINYINKMEDIQSEDLTNISNYEIIEELKYINDQIDKTLIIYNEKEKYIYNGSDYYRQLNKIKYAYEKEIQRRNRIVDIRDFVINDMNYKVSELNKKNKNKIDNEHQIYFYYFYGGVGGSGHYKSSSKSYNTFLCDKSRTDEYFKIFCDLYYGTNMYNDYNKISFNTISDRQMKYDKIEGKFRIILHQYILDH